MLLKSLILIVAYFNNLSYNLTIYVNNLYRNLINQPNLIKETLEKQLSQIFFKIAVLNSFTRNIGGRGLYVFIKAFLKTPVINSTF